MILPISTSLANRKARQKSKSKFRSAYYDGARRGELLESEELATALRMASSRYRAYLIGFGPDDDYTAAADGERQALQAVTDAHQNGVTRDTLDDWLQVVQLWADSCGPFADCDAPPSPHELLQEVSQ